MTLEEKGSRVECSKKSVVCIVSYRSRLASRVLVSLRFIGVVFPVSWLCFSWSSGRAGSFPDTYSFGTNDTGHRMHGMEESGFSILICLSEF
ncbi:hypothetical protein Tco_0355812 [Tanacetum coccineum]